MQDDRGPDVQQESSRRAALAALAVLAVLIVAGLWLGGLLGHVGALQDCVAAGRTNCAPVATRTP